MDKNMYSVLSFSSIIPSVCTVCDHQASEIVCMYINLEYEYVKDKNM